MLISWQEASEIEDLDLCVIGAGAAGITLAREFADRSGRVLLIESGGFEFSQSTQSLYDTAVTGLRYPVSASRLRFFGGTTNHWSGQSRPFEPIDFEERPGIPFSGWPIDYEEYARFLDAAHGISGLGPVDYEPARWSDTLGDDPVAESSLVESKIFQLSIPNMRWGQEYRSDIENARNLFLLLDANAIELHTDSSGRTITDLEVGNLEGERRRIAARRFVLACGGIENPRLLLSSNSTVPVGIGNEYDNVGRFFREHPNLSVHALLGSAKLAQLPLAWEGSSTVRNQRATTVLRTIGLSSEAMRDNQLLGQTLFLWGARVPLEEEPPETEFEADVRRGPWPGATGAEFLLGAQTITEQASNPDSRVTLSDRLDPFGKSHAALDWRLTEFDYVSLRAGAEILAAELSRLGIARSRLQPWTRDPSSTITPGVGYHHMGTTRMSREPVDGVVDEDCRVHGVDNLWIAGCSVFPTGGLANPTMNLVALSLRLAEHLRR